MKSPQTRCRWSQNAHATCDGDVNQEHNTRSPWTNLTTTTARHTNTFTPDRNQGRCAAKKSGEIRRTRFRGSGGNRQGDSAKDLLTESSSSLDSRTRKEKSNSGAPGQPLPTNSALAVNLRQKLRHSQSTLAIRSGAPTHPRQQLLCSRSTFASNFAALPATSALQDLRQQLRRSR